MAGRFLDTSNIKMGFWIAAGFTLFGLVVGLVTHVVHK